MSKTDPRKLESYLEQKGSYEGGLDPEVERLADSLQQWRYEAELQPRPGFVNEVAEQLQEQQQARPREQRRGNAMEWMKRLFVGAVGTAAVVAFVLFVFGLFEQPPVEPAVGERQTPRASAEVPAVATAVPSPTHVPVTSQVDGATMAPAPTAESSSVSGQVVSCRAVPRPALVLGHNISLDRLNLTLVDPLSGDRCTVSTRAYASGALTVSGDTLYYPRRDQDDGTITVWQHPLDGDPAPLSFTPTPALSSPWFGLAVSSDGRHIVWATFSDDVEGASDARYRSTVWLGDLQAETATLLWHEDTPDTFPPTIEPLHFSPEENVVYFARRPYGIGGTGPFPAQYTGLYALSLDGGEPQPLFACQSPFEACINDVDFEQRLLATVANEGEQAALRIVAFDGAEVARYTPADAGYVADPVFNPTGDVAFITAHVARAEDETPLFRPGAIRLLTAPYTDEPQTLVQNTDVFFELWPWLDTNRLLSGDWTNGQGLAVLSLSGERTTVPESETAVPITVLPAEP